MGLTVVSAACSSSSSSRNAHATTTSSTVAPSSQSSTTSPTTAGVPNCAANALAVGVLGSGGAAGTIETTFAFRNTSTTACILDGYAGAQMLDSSGRPLPTNVVRGGGYSFTNFAPARLTLTPGQSAYFNAGYSDVPSGGQGACPAATQIEITPPNAFGQLVTAFNSTVCNNGTLTFSPVFGSGSPQTQTTAPHG